MTSQILLKRLKKILVCTTHSSSFIPRASIRLELMTEGKFLAGMRDKATLQSQTKQKFYWHYGVLTQGNSRGTNTSSFCTISAVV